MAMRHSVVLDVKRCRGCTTCIKCCPTEAIRVRGRRATILPDRCIDCGNCALACFPQALTIGAPDWRLHFDPERCIACKLCLKSCPLGLFHIEFTEA